MIAARALQLTVDSAKKIAEEYVSTVFDSTYYIYDAKKNDNGYRFMVACTREDMKRDPAVGGVTVFESGNVDALPNDRIREMKEAAAVQAAQERGELARNADGYVLRRHARIKARCWTSDNIGMKIGAEGGIFIEQDIPIWRFSIHYYFAQGESPALDVIDVDAKSGQVHPLSQEQIMAVVGGLKSIQKVGASPSMSKRNGTATKLFGAT